jgi:hypothetical protein
MKMTPRERELFAELKTELAKRLPVDPARIEIVFAHTETLGRRPVREHRFHASAKFVDASTLALED